MIVLVKNRGNDRNANKLYRASEELKDRILT